MATSSILGGLHLPEEVGGKDIHALGPSDNSDSGSDAVGAYSDDELASDSDAVGTGERASIGAGRDQPDADILPDHIETEPGTDVDLDFEEAADGDFNDVAEVEALAGDDDLDIEEDADDFEGDDEEAKPSRKPGQLPS